MTAALTGLPLLALLVACYVALVVLADRFIAAGRGPSWPSAESGPVSNPACFDGGPDWCCVDSDGTGLWCESCLAYAAPIDGSEAAS